MVVNVDPSCVSVHFLGQNQNWNQGYNNYWNPGGYGNQGYGYGGQQGGYGGYGPYGQYDYSSGYYGYGGYGYSKWTGPPSCAYLPDHDV